MVCALALHRRECEGSILEWALAREEPLSQEAQTFIGRSVILLLRRGALRPGGMCRPVTHEHAKTAQRRVSRRKRGSHRRQKAVKLLAKAHQTVRRQRQDFHHKTALALVRANDTIYHEDLQVRTMVRN